MLQRVSIPDPGAIAATTAMTALIPAGWTTIGGPCDEPYAVNWSASSADGDQGEYRKRSARQRDDRP